MICASRRGRMPQLVFGVAKLIVVSAVFAISRSDDGQVYCSSACVTGAQSLPEELYHGIHSICAVMHHSCVIPESSSECSAQTLRMKDHAFTIKSMEFAHTDGGTFLKILWDIPNMENWADARKGTISWILKLTIDDTSCITLTFNATSLDRYKGQFMTPCIKIDSTVHHSLSYTSYMTHGDSTYLTHSQDIKIAPSADSESSVSFPLKPNFSAVVSGESLQMSYTQDKMTTLLYYLSIYRTELGKCHVTSPPIKADTVPGYPIGVLKYNLKEFESCKVYCFQISPIGLNNCANNCIARFIDTSYFHLPDFLPNRECSRWNATLIALDRSIGNEVTVEFRQCCGYEGCFDRFRIGLCHLYDDDCERYKTCSPYYFSNIYPDLYTRTFQNLEPGKYCSKVEAAGSHGNNVLNSNVVEVRKVVTPSHGDIVVIPPDESDRKIVTIGVGVGFFVIVAVCVSGFIYWRRRKRLLLPDTEILKNDDILLHQGRAAEISCLVLHTYDSLIKERVLALVDVLRMGTNVDVVLCCENLDCIDLEGGEEWINQQLKFEDPSPCVNGGQRKHRKVLIVESERAVAYQNYWREIAVGDCVDVNVGDARNPFWNTQDQPPGDRSLERLFVYALKVIMSREREALDDYFHLFVVHFSDVTPREVQLERLIPHERYHLPRDVLTLCADLELDTPNPLPPARISELRAALENSSYFCRFLDEIY